LAESGELLADEVESHGVLLHADVTAEGIDQVKDGLVKPPASLLALLLNGGLRCGGGGYAGRVISCITLRLR